MTAGVRLAVDLMVGCIVVGGILAAMFIPNLWRALKSVGPPALGIVLGWIYDLYLVLCRLLSRWGRVR